MSLRPTGSAVLLAAVLAAHAAPSSAEQTTVAPTAAGAAVFVLDRVLPDAVVLPPPSDEPLWRLLSEPTAGVDESALRFYAARGETARVAAEIARLTRLHPGWVAPADLYAGSAQADADILLREAIEDGRDADAHGLATDALAGDPAWRPPADLAPALRRAVLVRALIEASERGEHARALAASRLAPDLLSCARVDVLWRTAEALAVEVDAAAAEAAFAYVVETCSNAHERRATLQKAIARLDGAAVDRLIARAEAVAPIEDPERIRLDAALARVSRALDTGRPDEEAVHRLEVAALETADAKAFELVGWHRHALDGRPDAAQAAFRSAVDLGGGAAPALGLVIALRALDRPEEAEALAFAWRGASPELADAYAALVLKTILHAENERLSADSRRRLETYLGETGDVRVAAALGWRDYRAGDHRSARRLFESILDVAPDADAVFGLALSLHATGDRAGLRALAARDVPGREAVARVVAWGEPAREGPRQDPAAALSARALALFEASRYAEAAAVLEQAGGPAPDDRGMRLLYGYALLHSGRANAAFAVFAALDAQHRTSESMWGKHHAQQRMTDGY